MSLKKLWTAIRGATNEGVEAVVDTQAIRILEQELREAREEIKKSDQSLTSIMAKRKLGEGKVNALQADIEKYTNHAIAASETDQALALECAEKVAELEGQLSGEQELLNGFVQSEATLKDNISKAKINVRRMEQQIDQVKAVESVQKAQVAASNANVGANSKVKTALDSLERIKEKQNLRAAELSAAEERAAEESGSALDERLKKAGIASGGGGNSSAEDKLAQLLAKKAG